MGNFLWVLYWLVVAVVFIGITAYLVMNIINLRKSSIKSFEGEPVETDATVDDKSKAYFKTIRAADARSSENITTLVLSYKVNGITFTKEVRLIDIREKLRTGDTVRIVYDSLDAGHALLADGSETTSAKNGIKWAFGYYAMLFIIGAFMFFRIAAAVE